MYCGSGSSCWIQCVEEHIALIGVLVLVEHVLDEPSVLFEPFVTMGARERLGHGATIKQDPPASANNLAV